MDVWWFCTLVIYALICGLLGIAIAECKRRSKTEGFMLGLLLAVVGIAVEIALPKGSHR